MTHVQAMATSKELAALSAVMAILLRWSVSIHSYSGQGSPPMYGDYEAQRHWMEITYNLPIKEWYQNSTNNDLLYWGLDYPPLSAYHSYVCGMIANWIDPKFVALHHSRGHESYSHKLFMRTSVILSDVFIFIPAVFCWCFAVGSQVNQRKLFTGFPKPLVILMYPGLILIDHGHFQYNSVSIGLMIAALTALIKNSNFIASIFFCLALNFKQMELYHALPFFCYLFGQCMSHGTVFKKLLELMKLGTTVVLTFTVVWFPLATSNSVINALIRLFPLNRGIYEDKVANVWCSGSVFYKFHKIWGKTDVAVMCLSATVIAVLPSCVNLIMYPGLKRMHYAVVNSSLAFFLFSYQVHEKSILLAAIPVALIAAMDCSSHSIQFFPCLWFLSLSTFSMVPLLVRDGHTISTISLTIFYPLLSVLLNCGFDSTSRNSPFQVLLQSRFKFGAFISIVGCSLLTLTILTLEPPNSYPDLFPFLISAFACVHFVLFFFYYNYLQFKVPVESFLENEQK